MASLSHTMQRKAFSAAIDVALKRLNKDRKKDYFRLSTWRKDLWARVFKPESYEGARKIVRNPENNDEVCEHYVRRTGSPCGKDDGIKPWI